MESDQEISGSSIAAKPQAEQVVWLRAFADKLSDYASKPNGQRGHYPNKNDRLGFYICYKYFGLKFDRYLMTSRSHTDFNPSKKQIINELRSEEVEVRPEWCGKYHEHLRVPGSYATVRYGDIWYILSESGIPEPFKKWPGAQHLDWDVG